MRHWFPGSSSQEPSGWPGSQGVSPKHWLAVKLALIGVIAVAVTGLLSFMMMWWSSPLFRTGVSPGDLSYLDRFSPSAFAASGVVPTSYAAFAFVLGVVIGALFRRIVPAMAVTLLIFVAVQLIIPNLVRPHYPVRSAQISEPISARFLDNNVIFINNGKLTLPIDVPGALVNIPGALVLSNEAVTRTGREYVLPSTDCQAGTVNQCMALIASKDIHQSVNYQPSSHYWRFQWCETAIFLILTLLLAAIGMWSIRPDRSLAMRWLTPAVSAIYHRGPAPEQAAAMARSLRTALHAKEL